MSSTREEGPAMQNVKAREGQWYLHRVSRESFCVIYVDEAHRVIDVRDDSGDIDEFDFEEWATMDLELCMPPTGWMALDEEDDFDFGSEDLPTGAEPEDVRETHKPPSRPH
jgi:hypothetical protein